MCRFTVVRLLCEHPHKVQASLCKGPFLVDHKIDIVVTDIVQRQGIIACKGCLAGWGKTKIERPPGGASVGAFALGWPPNLWAYETRNNNDFVTAYPMSDAFIARHDISMPRQIKRHEGLHYCIANKEGEHDNPSIAPCALPQALTGAPYSMVHVPNWTDWHPNTTRKFTAFVPLGMNTRLLDVRPNQALMATPVAPTEAYARSLDQMPGLEVQDDLFDAIEMREQQFVLLSQGRDEIKDYGDPLVIFGCAKEERRCPVDQHDYIVRNGRRCVSVWHRHEMRYIPEAIDFRGWRDYKTNEINCMARSRGEFA